MSSGFVSGGTVDAPIERSDEWLTAQKEIEANRQRKLDEQARLSSGKSLFETLEANKAAKQDAFDEANKLKNQFRALDEDEIDFLDSVMESTRREEERVKRETKEGLEVFRKQQEAQDKKALSGSGIGEDEDVVGEESWTTAGGRKRKRTKEKEVLKGVKVRRGSTVEGKIEIASTPSTASRKPQTESPVVSNAGKATSSVTPAAPPVVVKSSLVAYGSDSEDD